MTPPTQGQPSNYRFADLTLDVSRRSLTRNGEPIELKTLDFDLLRFLVEQAPNVVNADILAEKVWGRHFVSPENVAQRVMLLRQSLSDDATKPRYIETVRNKGYRLIPVVEKKPPHETGTVPQRRRWLAPAATAALLLSVGISVAAYWVAGTAEQPAPNASFVAVLPFENRSPDPDDAYFADGMQDEIVSQLNEIGGLRVIPIRLADGAQAPIAEIVRKLNVATTLGGTVYYAEGRVKVMPRLTQTATGVSLWSDSYERELDNIFAIQSEIALEVARALRIQLSDAERQRIARVPTGNPKARDMYLKARALQSREMPDDVLKAIAAVEEALSIDQAFTEAWILDANASNVAQFFDPRNAAEHRARGEHAARRAVELDPESGGAYAALGFALWMKKDWRGSEEAFRKAASLNALPDVSSYCILQLAAGKFAAARDLIEEGRALQPQNPTVHRFLMFAYAALGEWATATGLYESGTELFGPSWREGPATWMHWLVGNGDLAKARAIPVEDDLNHAMLESLDAPDEALAQLHRTHDTTGAGNPNRRLYISLWAGHFGDNALAFEAARAAIDEQGGLIVYVWLPQLAPMRRMPEFKAYLREIGMVDYWHEYGWPDICRERGGDDFECD